MPMPVVLGAALTLGAGALAGLRRGRWLGLGMFSMGTGLVAAGALVVELLVRSRCRTTLGRQEGRRGAEGEAADNLLQQELQQLVEVAITQPRLLLNDHWQTTVHNVARQLGVSNGGAVPWQLLFVYRQLEAVVDSLSYEELYDIFGGNPPPAAITREEARRLPSREYKGDRDAGRSDTKACPICLQDYSKGERLAVLPQCCHVYHARCVTRWLRSRGDCPICRSLVKDELRRSTRLC